MAAVVEVEPAVLPKTPYCRTARGNAETIRIQERPGIRKWHAHRFAPPDQEKPALALLRTPNSSGWDRYPAHTKATNQERIQHGLPHPSIERIASTFSRKTATKKLHASIMRKISKNTPDRLPSYKPRCKPALHMSWQGNPPTKTCGVSGNASNLAHVTSATSSMIGPIRRLPSAILARRTALAAKSISQ